jgi:hypothetical protein
MSFLKIGDRAAGAIKSGGTTRRAAKMVCLDLDHPDVEQFVNWKVREELKVAAWPRASSIFPKTAGTGQEAGPEARLRFQRRSLHDRQRPELQQLRPHPQPLLQSRRRRRRLESHLAHQRQSRQDDQGPRSVGADRLRRLALRRSRRAIRRHDQPMAHLPQIGRSTPPTPASPATRACSPPAESGGGSIR